MSLGFNGSVAGEGILNVDGVPKLKLDAATGLLTTAEIYKSVVGPAFLATRSGAAQAMTDGVALKAVMGTKVYDNVNGYDIALSRWTPGVLGLYEITGALAISHPGQSPTTILSVRINGADVRRIAQITGASGANPRGSTKIVIASVTDYVELFVMNVGSSGNITVAGTVDEFSGVRLRS